MQAGNEKKFSNIKFCWCPPGEFMMGSPENEPRRSCDENQVHVTLTKGRGSSRQGRLILPRTIQSKRKWSHLTMINFLLFIFATIGMTNIIVDSSLFEPVRCWLKSVLNAKVYELFECHQCCGTWCGFVCGALLLSWHPIVIIMCGCAGSFLASTHYLLTELILSKTDFEIDLEK